MNFYRAYSRVLDKKEICIEWLWRNNSNAGANVRSDFGMNMKRSPQVLSCCWGTKVLCLNAATTRKRALIQRVLDRKACFYRRDPKSGGPQVVAANVDTVFVVTSMNSDSNIRRLDRYLSLAWDRWCFPVIAPEQKRLATRMPI